MRAKKAQYGEFKCERRQQQCQKTCSALALKNFFGYFTEKKMLLLAKALGLRSRYASWSLRMFIQSSFIFCFTERKMQYVTAKHKMLCKHSTQRRPHPHHQLTAASSQQAREKLQGKGNNSQMQFSQKADGIIMRYAQISWIICCCFFSQKTLNFCLYYTVYFVCVCVCV